MGSGAAITGRPRTFSRAGQTKRGGSYRAARMVVLSVLIVFAFHVLASFRTGFNHKAKEEAEDSAWHSRREARELHHEPSEGRGSGANADVIADVSRRESPAKDPGNRGVIKMPLSHGIRGEDTAAAVSNSHDFASKDRDSTERMQPTAGVAGEERKGGTGGTHEAYEEDHEHEGEGEGEDGEGSVPKVPQKKTGQSEMSGQSVESLGGFRGAVVTEAGEAEVVEREGRNSEDQSRGGLEDPFSQEQTLGEKARDGAAESGSPGQDAELEAGSSRDASVQQTGGERLTTAEAWQSEHVADGKVPKDVAEGGEEAAADGTERDEHGEASQSKSASKGGTGEGGGEASRDGGGQEANDGNRAVEETKEGEQGEGEETMQDRVQGSGAQERLLGDPDPKPRAAQQESGGEERSGASEAEEEKEEGQEEEERSTIKRGSETQRIDDEGEEGKEEGGEGETGGEAGEGVSANGGSEREEGRANAGDPEGGAQGSQTEADGGGRGDKGGANGEGDGGGNLGAGGLDSKSDREEGGEAREAESKNGAEEEDGAESGVGAEVGGRSGGEGGDGEEEDEEGANQRQGREEEGARRIGLEVGTGRASEAAGSGVAGSQAEAQGEEEGGKGVGGTTGEAAEEEEGPGAEGEKSTAGQRDLVELGEAEKEEGAGNGEGGLEKQEQAEATEEGEDGLGLTSRELGGGQDAGVQGEGVGGGVVAEDNKAEVGTTGTLLASPGGGPGEGRGGKPSKVRTVSKRKTGARRGKLKKKKVDQFTGLRKSTAVANKAAGGRSGRRRMRKGKRRGAKRGVRPRKQRRFHSKPDKVEIINLGEPDGKTEEEEETDGVQSHAAVGQGTGGAVEEETGEGDGGEAADEEEGAVTESEAEGEVEKEGRGGRVGREEGEDNDTGEEGTEEPFGEGQEREDGGGEEESGNGAASKAVEVQEEGGEERKAEEESQAGSAGTVDKSEGEGGASGEKEGTSEEAKEGKAGAEEQRAGSRPEVQEEEGKEGGEGGEEDPEVLAGMQSRAAIGSDEADGTQESVRAESEAERQGGEQKVLARSVEADDTAGVSGARQADTGQAEQGDGAGVREPAGNFLEKEAAVTRTSWVKDLLPGRQMKPRFRGRPSRNADESSEAAEEKTSTLVMEARAGGFQGEVVVDSGAAEETKRVAESETAEADSAKTGRTEPLGEEGAEGETGEGGASGGQQEPANGKEEQDEEVQAGAAVESTTGVPSERLDGRGESEDGSQSRASSAASVAQGSESRGSDEGLIPLVTIFTKPERTPCETNHFAYRTLQAARRHNERVHVIGPEAWRSLEGALGVQLEPWGSYQPVLDKFREEIGVPKINHVRWYVLQEFLERHREYRHVFYFEPDITVFANITEAAAQLLEPWERHIMLMQRWPRLWAPLGPTQRPSSTRVFGLTSLWSPQGLRDFLRFHRFFLQMDALNGRSATRFLVELEDYSDEVILGWYAYQACWRRRGAPPCKGERTSGITSHRVQRVRGKFYPKFNVSSGAKPRMCKLTSWSDPGWCVFDRDNAVASRSFQFDPGMKCPMTLTYKHFEDWMGVAQQPLEAVQFLTARLQGRKPWMARRLLEASRQESSVGWNE